MKRLLAALLAVAAVAVSPAVAQAPSLALSPSTERSGRIDLNLAGPPGATVSVAEVSGTPRPIGDVILDAQGAASVPEAATWSCSLRTRTFYAQGTAPDGTPLAADASTRTPGCARRYRVTARPRRPRASRSITVRLTDTFELGGFRARACARGPGKQRTCARLQLADGDDSATARLRLPRPGRWRLNVRVGGKRRDRETVHVRRAPGRVSLLATGDSMIQIIDGFLKQRLQSARVGVRSDARISTGLSKPSVLNWRRHARKQVRSAHPDVTVMFIGANDGFAFGATQCCGRGWQKAYAKVASAMMSTYARHGAGTVYWSLLPAPRGGSFRRVFVAVNAALRLAARRHPAAVKLVDLPKTFTPGYRFRQSITWHGRSVSVRQPDGVHLNSAGASIAATLIIRQMRRDGVI